LALLSEAVDYPTLSALNPHLPPELEKVEELEKPEDGWRWRRMSGAEKKRARKDYPAALKRRKEYEQALKARSHSPEFLAAPRELTRTVSDLERRGLLRYDPQARLHDLHPVVRGVAAGGPRQEEKTRYGQRVVDHFSQQAHAPYEEAETLEDVRNGLNVARALLQMGRHQQACDAYRGDLAGALIHNLEAHAEILSLLRPFFPQGWATLSSGLNTSDCGYLANDAAIALEMATGGTREALAALGASLLAGLRRADWRNVRILLSNTSCFLVSESRLAKEECSLRLALDLAGLTDEQPVLFGARLDRFGQLARTGQWQAAEAMWQLLDPMGRDWPRAVYRPGDAESAYALFRFWQGDMGEEHLTHAEQLARAGKDRSTIRFLHRLRGEWQLGQGQHALAAESLHEAVRLAREVGQPDGQTEALFALARFSLNQLHDPCQEAERLPKARKPCHRAIAAAALWLAVGDRDEAEKHALTAYKWAWADGEPYVRRYELNQARDLLEQLGAEIPELPAYDPAKEEKLPWEDELVAAIEKLRAEKEAKEAAETSEEE